jgi:hypothetical protein
VADLSRLNSLGVQDLVDRPLASNDGLDILEDVGEGLEHPVADALLNLWARAGSSVTEEMRGERVHNARSSPQGRSRRRACP